MCCVSLEYFQESRLESLSEEASWSAPGREKVTRLADASNPSFLGLLHAWEAVLRHSEVKDKGGRDAYVRNSYVQQSSTR